MLIRISEEYGGREVRFPSARLFVDAAFAREAGVIDTHRPQTVRPTAAVVFKQTLAGVRFIERHTMRTGIDILGLTFMRPSHTLSFRAQYRIAGDTETVRVIAAIYYHKVGGVNHADHTGDCKSERRNRE